MRMNFKYLGAVVWTGDLGVPVPRVGETVVLNYPADMNQAAETRTHEVSTVTYDMVNGIGGSTCTVELIDLTEKSDCSPRLTRTQLTALFAVWGTSSRNKEWGNAPVLADIFLQLAARV